MWINQQRNVYSNDLYGNEEREASNDEIEALKDLYISLNGDLWESNYNWNEDDPCLNSWEGVYCNKRGNVIGIELSKIFDRNSDGFIDALASIEKAKH